VARIATAPHRVGLLLHARGRAQGEPARHEEVARIAVGDVDDVALLPDVLDVLPKNDLHAASTSGPRSPGRDSSHRPGRRICAWLFMRLRPPALDRPGAIHHTGRAEGSAPGSSCGF